MNWIWLINWFIILLGWIIFSWFVVESIYCSYIMVFLSVWYSSNATLHSLASCSRVNSFSRLSVEAYNTLRSYHSNRQWMSVESCTTVHSHSSNILARVNYSLQYWYTHSSNYNLAILASPVKYQLKSLLDYNYHINPFTAIHSWLMTIWGYMPLSA